MKTKILVVLSILLWTNWQIQAASKIAYLTASENVEFLDDDESASYNWFKTNYPTGEFINCAQIENGLDLSLYEMIWLHIDRIGIERGANNLPAAFISSKVVGAMKEFYNAGGNLFLCNHATQYIVSIERLAENRSPAIFGSGQGGTGTDNWTFNANIGYHPNESRPSYNHESHAAFKNLEFKTGMNPAGDWLHKSCGLIGQGYREDHNCMWDLNGFGYGSSFPDKNVVEAFETENTAVVLGTWGHVVDYCCAGVIEFAPTSSVKGRCIAIGLAAYEWNQNDQVNIFQSNIEILSDNIIRYLAPTTFASSGIVQDKENIAEFSISGSGKTVFYKGLEVGSTMQVVNQYGAIVQSIIITSSNGDFTLPFEGLYILKTTRGTTKLLLH